MIPKIIHYCWFGGNTKPASVLNYIDTWKKHLPDYEIKEWNESNFDINMNDFVSEAYKYKKYAFVSDFCRLYILYKYGGLYFDTDVEVLKNMDCFLSNSFFLGLESDDQVGTCVIGSTINNEVLKILLEFYSDRHFYLGEGHFNIQPNTVIVTKLLKTIPQESYTIYPADYFSPLSYNTNKMNITENTYSIHHFKGSWMSWYVKFENKLCVFLGIKNRFILSRLSRIRYVNMSKIISKIKRE